MIYINYFECFFRLEIIPDWKSLKPCNEIKTKGSVLGLGCVDSTYSLQCAPCINDYKHEDLPTLLVCLQYLTQLEVIIYILHNFYLIN